MSQYDPAPAPSDPPASLSADPSAPYRIYVAAPYRRHALARDVHAKLRDAGMEATSRWAVIAERGPDAAPAAFGIDRADLARSDAMIALLDEAGGKETYCEIEVARAAGIPIAWVDGLPDVARDNNGIVPSYRRSVAMGCHEPMSLHAYAIATGRARGHQDAAAAIAWLRTMAAARPSGIDDADGYRDGRRDGIAGAGARRPFPIDPPIHALTSGALMGVAAERARQDAKWGRAPGDWPIDPGVKIAVLTEEVGEVARAVLERSPLAHLREELIQVAAVAVAWAECVDAGTERHR